jgi:cell division protein FtsW (lipid II flippase)
LVRDWSRSSNRFKTVQALLLLGFSYLILQFIALRHFQQYQLAERPWINIGILGLPVVALGIAVIMAKAEIVSRTKTSYKKLQRVVCAFAALASIALLLQSALYLFLDVLIDHHSRWYIVRADRQYTGH